MDSVGVNVIETAALGRPFQLGMLYDCRKDALVPGITLWDNEQLKESIRTRPQINTDFRVTASDSIEDKSSLLNIDISLGLSFLGGLLHVGGAARYLNDTKKSFKQHRLTLYYHSTSTFKELTINHLASGNIAHNEIFENETATHVVTAVLYGADACFVFDREVSSDENESTVAGEVQAAYDKLKGISEGANIDLSINDNQKTAVQKFTCTFYGDFQLPSNPTSFEDALKVYAELPKLLGENKELVVPLRVWLYPLDKPHLRATKLQRNISLDLIKNFELVIESLSALEMKGSDLLKDTPALTFAALNEKIQNMKRNCHHYKLSFIKKLGILLPKIRGDVEKETALIDLLHEHEESPFRESDLEHWLNEKENESDVVKTVLRQLKDFGAKVEMNLEKCLMDLKFINLVCYTFTSLNRSDVLLSKQKDYLSLSSRRNNNESTSESKQNTWLTPKIKNTMKSNLQLFKRLINSKDRKPAMFIITSKEMENNPGSCILLYENGCDEEICFAPPSKPACPIIEQVRDGSVVLKVRPPCHATVELKLLYKMEEEKSWKSQPVTQSQDTVTLTDLNADTKYEIKCAAVGNLNYSVDSDVITVITKRTAKNREEQMVTSEDSAIIQEDLEDIKDSISTQDLPSSVNTLKEYLRLQDLVELNIGVTGETGSGKSTFVNAFRGLEDEEEGSAKTGPLETTTEPEVYLHPKYKNVKVWDLPGIETPNFKADEYLELVQFERYDMIIIITSDRFRECHTQLAKEIMRMRKTFYFVRSKIDFCITAEKRKKNFDEKKTLDIIREACENGLRKIGIEDPVVFLISGWELGKYDFNVLQERMEKELPEHKRRVLMLALPNITLEINEKKKKALEENIGKVAFLSACVAAVPVPGLSITADTAIIADELRKYYSTFDLDDPSLQRLCERSWKTVDELKSLIKSPLYQGINPSSILTLLGATSFLISEDAIELLVSFIPIIGTLVAGGLSYLTVSTMLKRALNDIADDARNVMASLENEV